MMQYLLLLFFFISSSFLTAQDFGSNQELLNFSKFLSERYTNKKREALQKIQALKRPVKTTSAGGKTMELIEFDGENPIYYTTFNVNAAKSIATNHIQPGGGNGYNLNGSTEVLGIWDEGIARTTHQEFGSRVMIGDGTSSISDHGTHVAGTMIAAGMFPSSKGMSPSANLRTFNWSNDLSEMAAAAAAGMYVSNHSYGFVLGWEDSDWYGDETVSNSEDYLFGYYHLYTQYIDYITNLAPYYTICFAAGNDRGDGPTGQIAEIDGGLDGYDCIGPQGVAKNILTIGAVNDLVNGYSGSSSVVMTSFSTWGPTDDGRIKPDLVANGVSLISSLGDSDTSYGSSSGTSMATPSISGSIGLLLQHQRKLYGNVVLRSSTLKGLLLHTADDAGNVGPDYKFGWGLANFRRAAELMSLSAQSTINIQEFRLNQGKVVEIPILKSAAEDLKITIAWNDPYGSVPVKSLNPPTKILVNDIDLRLVAETTNFPWVLNKNNPNNPATKGDNNTDNVEQIIVSSSEEKYYTLRISHKGTLFGGSQVVSLIISGNKPIETNIVVNNTAISGNKGYIAYNSINSNATIQTNANVTFISGASINLTPGFTVQPGAIFLAKTGVSGGSFYSNSTQATEYPELVFEPVEDSEMLKINSKEDPVISDQLLSNKQGVLVFPNPSQDFVKVTIPDEFMGLPGKITLTNIIGKTLESFDYNPEEGLIKALDLRRHKAGVYYLCIDFGSQQLVEKIIKM